MIKRRIKVLVLVSMIAFYMLFVSWTFQQYKAYVNNAIAEWTKLGYPVEWLDYHSYFTFTLGQVALILGFGLTLFWICIGIVSFKPKSLSVKQKILPVILMFSCVVCSACTTNCRSGYGLFQSLKK